MNELVKGLSQNDVVTYPHAFFKWVYANPCPSLVGIRRIPAYHVDYTTGYRLEYASLARTKFGLHQRKTSLLLAYSILKSTSIFLYKSSLCTFNS